MWSVISTWQSTNKTSGHPASGDHFWFALIPAYCLPHVVAKSQHSMTAGRGKLGALYLENSWALPHGCLPLVNFNLYLCCNILCCCFSVAKLCLTLCDPMHCSRPGSSVLHYLPKFAQILSTELVMLSTISSFAAPFSFSLQSFPDSGPFPVSWLFTSGSQNFGASASASVLPMNIQDWFPLGLTGLIALLSWGRSRVFSSTAVWKHHFFSVQPSLWLINCSSEYYCFWWVIWGLIVNYQAENSLVDPWICNLC